MNDLQQKYRTRNYICLAEQKDCKGWSTVDFPNWDIDVNFRLIHKTHESILNAYLLDNDVEIEFKVNGMVAFSIVETGFIWAYDEEVEYRLKETKPKNNFKDYGFTADFEGEITFEDHKKIYHGYIIINNTREENKSYRYWDRAGVSYYHDGAISEVCDLTPIEKPWYENEDNFPTLMVRNTCPSKPDFRNEYSSVWNHSYFKEKYEPYGWEYATNEEIESLKITK